MYRYSIDVRSKFDRVSREISYVLFASLKNLLAHALNLVFPPTCVNCRRAGELICHICVGESTAVGTDVCRKCAEPMANAGTCSRCIAERSNLDRLYASYLYDSPVGAAIKAYKFEDIRALGAVLGELFDIEAMRRCEADMVIPVPLHHSRMRSRGYNQSELLGRVLSHRLSKYAVAEFRSDVLVRSRDTHSQSAQPTAAARHESLKNAFQVRYDAAGANGPGPVDGKRILLVDDVFTTGSTVQACADALKSEGASWVGVATLAYQPLGGD